MVVTIARQFGSGGREIGKKLSNKLNIDFYDKELIFLAAKQSGINPEVLEKYDEKSTNSLLYSLSVGASAFGAGLLGVPQITLNEKIFLAQSDIIKKAAEMPCVIVGRCADHILRERNDCIRIFIYADFDFRVDRACREHPEIPKDKAASVIRKTDKSRESYYNYYSSSKWGNPENYDLCINSATLGIDGTVNLIAAYIRERGYNFMPPKG